MTDATIALSSVREGLASRPVSHRAASLDGRLSPVVRAYLIAVLIPIGFNVGDFQLTLLRCFLLLVTVPVVVQLLLGRFGKIYLTDILFLIFMALSAVALQLSSPDQAATQMGSVGMEFIGGYAIARGYIRTRTDFLMLSRTLIWVVAAFTLTSIPETITGRSPIIQLLDKLPVVDSWTMVSQQARMGLERVQGVFAHPIHFGLFCSMMFPLAIIAMRPCWSSGQRWGLGLLIAANVVMSVSSGALLALVLQLILLGWVTLTRDIRFRWIIFAALVTVAYVAIDLASNRTPLRVFMSYATFSSHNAYYRALIFQWGMVNVWANPWFGIGLRDWIRPDYMNSGTVDNFWLLQTMRYGIPAFLVLVLGWAYGIGRIMFRSYGDDWTLIWIRRAWVFTFLGLSFTLCTVHLWTNVYSFVFFMFGAGFWLIQAQPESGDAAAPEPDLPRAPVYSRFAPGVPSATTRFAPPSRSVAAPPDSGPAPPSYARDLTVEPTRRS